MRANPARQATPITRSGSQGSAGQRVRVAAGGTHHRESLDPQRIRDGRDIGPRLRQCRGPVVGRAAVTRAVVRDEPDVEPLRVGEQRLRQRPGLRCSVMPEHRQGSVFARRAAVVRVHGPAGTDRHIHLGDHVAR